MGYKNTNFRIGLSLFGCAENLLRKYTLFSAAPNVKILPPVPPEIDCPKLKEVVLIICCCPPNIPKLLLSLPSLLLSPLSSFSFLCSLTSLFVLKFCNFRIQFSLLFLLWCQFNAWCQNRLWATQRKSVKTMSHSQGHDDHVIMMLTTTIIHHTSLSASQVSSTSSMAKSKKPRSLPKASDLSFSKSSLIFCIWESIAVMVIVDTMSSCITFKKTLSLYPTN